MRTGQRTVTIEPRPVGSNGSGPTRSRLISAGHRSPARSTLGREPGPSSVVERTERAHEQERPHAPLHGRELVPRSRQRTIEAEQPVDDCVGQRNLDADGQSRRQPRNGHLSDQSGTPQSRCTPEDLGPIDGDRDAHLVRSQSRRGGRLPPGVQRSSRCSRPTWRRDTRGSHPSGPASPAGGRSRASRESRSTRLVSRLTAGHSRDGNASAHLLSVRAEQR